MGARATTLPAAPRVSPVRTLASLLTTPMSPQQILVASRYFLPLGRKRRPSFSLLPVRVSVRVRSEVTSPEKTLKKEFLPYWSMSVLNTKSMGAPFWSRAISPPSAVGIGLPSRGLGAYFTRLSRRFRVPSPVMEQPQNTGNRERLLMAARIPAFSSSGVKGSSMKNFSMSSSLVSATASLSACWYSSKWSAASPGSSILLPSAFVAVPLTTSTRPSTFSPETMGKVRGTTPWPYVSWRAS